jgi:hypothetical protein
VSGLDVASLATQFGPTGLIIGYLIWEKTRLDSKWRNHEEQRLKQDAARTEADKGLALALQALTIAIRRDV